jgi:DnaJ-class molecular chaperone
MGLGHTLTFNNHPDNLLWLCSNHHTAYDGGLFGPDKENTEFVVSFKHVLRHYKLTLWRTQNAISQNLFTVLEDCARLARQIEKAETHEQIAAIEKIASATLEKLPILAPVSENDPNFKAYGSISAGVASLLSDTTERIEVRLEKANDIRQEYVAAFGFVICPLCEGTGLHEGSDCPVCLGNREIDEHIADSIDVSDFDEIDCPLCEGTGYVQGDNCPACGGEARISRRYARGIDLSNYQNVDCPLCEGEGRFRAGECPECRGECVMERRLADQVDLRGYSQVSCPLCSGQGSRNGGDCPVCGGEAKINERDLERIDFRDYEMVSCPVCDGAGHSHDGDCPACAGNGELERRDIGEF